MKQSITYVPSTLKGARQMKQEGPVFNPTNNVNCIEPNNMKGK